MPHLYALNNYMMCLFCIFSCSLNSLDDDDDDDSDNEMSNDDTEDKTPTSPTGSYDQVVPPVDMEGIVIIPPTSSHSHSKTMST